MSGLTEQVTIHHKTCVPLQKPKESYKLRAVSPRKCGELQVRLVKEAESKRPAVAGLRLPIGGPSSILRRGLS